MEKITGSIERIVYENEENGYKVFRLREERTEALVTVTGCFPYITVGVVLEVIGFFSISKYGEQFEGKSYEEKIPTSIKGIEKYLSSGLIKGIGPVYGKKIVDHFKEKTLDILENYPERLKEIDGLGPKRVKQIVESYSSQKEIKNIMIFLQGHGVSPNYAMKIYIEYGQESIEKVRENPYRLSEEIYGIGFHIADNIAFDLGFERESAKRAMAGLRFVLIRNSGHGHVYMDRVELLKETEKILGVASELIEDSLMEMCIKRKVVIEDQEFVYLPSLNACENGVVSCLESLLLSGKYTVEERNKVVENIVAKRKIMYSEEQKNAILLALEAKVMVLSGGPGTGKSTVTLGIIDALEAIGQKVVLAAPTGRAAKRLSEITGKEAKTIHRLLEFSPQEGFMRNEEKPLTADIVIIDEASMIDVVLMYNLLKALANKTSLILVGDVDQLPSVGPGNILKDLIDSQMIHTVYLKEVFRQGKESRIITNAHLINQSKFPVVDNDEESDFFYLKENKRERIFPLIESLCKERLPKKYKIDPIKDIQVLVPVKKGTISAKTLNEMLQNALNPIGKYLTHGEVIYRVGDKVMQLKNNYDKKIFNGDIGKVIEVDSDERTLLISFDEELVTYEYQELDELQLAYAITIHKSQGSEYPIVIMPITPQHFMMLQKNLIYTGITRAKKLFILIATDRAIDIALQRDGIDQRKTRLKEKLIFLKESYS